MAQGKLQVQNFIPATATRRISTDPTDENLSTVDIGRDFVPATLQSKVTPITGTNITNTKNRKD